MTDLVAGADALASAFAGLAPVAAPAAAGPASSAPAPAPVVRFLTDKPRRADLVLAWPVELDGVPYRTVTVRRMSVAEVGAFMDALKDAPEGASVRFPIFDDERGAPLPDALWDVLDPDDHDALQRAAADFLPARFRAATTA